MRHIFTWQLILHLGNVRRAMSRCEQLPNFTRASWWWVRYYSKSTHRTRQGKIWKFVRNANKSDNILKYILFLHIQCVFTNNLCDVARVYSMAYTPHILWAQSLNINGAREVVCLSGCTKWMQHRWGRVIHRLHSSSTEFYIRF